jgi:hypothetical protein
VTDGGAGGREPGTLVDVEWVGELWRSVSAVQPAPSPALIALTAVAALVLVVQPAAWRWTRLLVTITHEGGHATAALLTGRRLSGIRLHSDTSGLTLSSGRPAGPGMVLMLMAGYLGPAAVGLGAAALLLAGHGLGLLWLFVGLLALMLVQIRNFFGFIAVIGVGIGLGLVSWFLPPDQQSALACLLTWVLLLAAPKPVLELISQRLRLRARVGSAGDRSDVDQLAALTRTPPWAWLGLFLLANLAGLTLGAAMLLPALVDLVAGVAA